jgi:hypothetical protein
MTTESRGRVFDKIVGEMKSFTSRNLRNAITEHVGERRKEWKIWLVKHPGKKNSNNKD